MLENISLQAKYLWALLKKGKITPKKAGNFFLNLYEMARGNVKPRSYPSVIIFDVTNHCNLSCQVCRVAPDKILSDSDESGFIPMGMMDYALFSGILREAGDKIMLALMYMAGEPLMNKEIYAMIKLADDMGTPTLLSSNGMLLTRANAEKLINSGLDFIKIAISGMSQPVYGKEHTGGEIARILSNVREMAELKRKMKSGVLIILDFILYAHNESELALARRFCEETGVILTTRAGRTSLGHKNVEDIMSKSSITEISPSKKLCDWLWRIMSVSWDGKVFPCCEFAFCGKPVELGDLSGGKSVRDVWTGDVFASYRRAHMEKGRGAFDVCKTCHYEGIGFQG